ncbi:hypothetical protein BDZ89DRAFT_1038158 [Hymenopellis radicata]|nr:hypothetical protein BDZ89DRAFT_1038158 [Hymenopellis radicata]
MVAVARTLAIRQALACSSEILLWNFPRWLGSRVYSLLTDTPMHCVHHCGSSSPIPGNPLSLRDSNYAPPVYLLDRLAFRFGVALPRLELIRTDSTYSPVAQLIRDIGHGSSLSNKYIVRAAAVGFHPAARLGGWYRRILLAGYLVVTQSVLTLLVLAPRSNYLPVGHFFLQFQAPEKHNTFLELLGYRNISRTVTSGFRLLEVLGKGERYERMPTLILTSIRTRVLDRQRIFGHAPPNAT